MANRKINLTELDFDGIKSNLKTFLSGQTEFQDYDFEGSGLSVLLDLLAYNTHYNAMYNNLSINEMFLDSARKRNSVVSLSKMLGYTPRSATSARALVNIRITCATIGPDIVYIPANSEFNTTVNGVSFIFRNKNIVSASGAGLVYNINNVELIEGITLDFRYTVAQGVKYIIPNTAVDLSTVSLRVQTNSTSSTFNTFTTAGSLVDISPTTRAYWIKEIDDGLYEIVFGDGIIGKALEPGNVVHINYTVSKMDAANGARLFNYNGATIVPSSTVSVTTVSPATNGSMVEDIDSIKFNAPKTYAAQNRAVTPDDYKALIYASVPGIKSVTVWGGEDNIPPVYGKTFICIKPTTTSKLTNQQKSNILTTILSSRNVVSITPEIVDPEYINIALDVTVYYNERETTRSPSELEAIIRETIFDYDDNDLQKFDGMFRFSKLSRLLDAAEPGITNNITTVLLRRKIAPRYNVSAEYSLNLINPFYTEGVPEDIAVSTGFFVYGSNDIHYLRDDGIGNMQLFTKGSSEAIIVVNPTIGTIDYAAGSINIKNLHITAIADIDFEISIKPKSNDVVSAFTQIAQIARDHLIVNVISDKSANGDLRGGKNYIFTTSRS